MRSMIYYTCLTATLFYTTDVTQGYIPPLISNHVPSSSTIHRNQHKYQNNIQNLYQNSLYSKTQLGTNTIQTESEKETFSLSKSLGKPFSGLKGDLKRRLPYYQTDWTDGFRRKSLASILFLYFACLGIPNI
jgi:hypothetical protein